jgi:acyl-coenzyme A thioesterase 13
MSCPGEPNSSTSTPPSHPETFSYITTLWSSLVHASPIYTFLLSPLTITHATPSHVLCRLTLSPVHLNSKGGLHGSVSATIVDCIGGLAIATHDLRSKTGASVEINVSYLGVARLGDEIEIEGKAEKVGGSLAFTTVVIRKVVEGKAGEVVVMGRHTKFVRQPGK